MLKFLLFMLGMIIFWRLVRYARRKFSERKKSKAVKMRISKKEALARRKRTLILLPLVVIILAAAVFFFYGNYLRYYFEFEGEEISTLEFDKEFGSGKGIEKLVILGETWSVQWQDGTVNKVNIIWSHGTQFAFVSGIPLQGTEVILKPPLTVTLIVLILLFVLFTGLIFFVIFWWPKVVRGGVFLKTAIKGIEEWSKIKFSDVGANKEAKQQLSTIIEFLKEPAKFTAFKAKMPKGVLLVGSPGCGKTYLARALAGEAEVPYLNIAGSEFTELFVGIGASKVRNLFDRAKKLAPCIVFIDEIDAFAKRRSGLTGAASPQEQEDTLRQLLSEMDGFSPASGILVLAATNQQALDPALLRPGRFDIKIEIPLPDRQGRKEILEIHAKGKPKKVEVDFDKIAGETPGLAGADMASIINEAAIRIVRGKRQEIEQEDLEWAVDRVTLGQEKKGQYLSQKEKEITAYHEAGHALVAKKLLLTDQVKRISIIPRAEGIGGFVRIASVEERYILTKERARAILAWQLGGRAAEIIALDLLSGGAKQDISEATKLAKEMVCHYGMSEKIGPQFLGEWAEVYTGGQVKDYSEYTAEIVDEEIEYLVLEAFEKAKEIIRRNREKLEKFKEALIEKETLNDQDLDKIVGEVI